MTKYIIKATILEGEHKDEVFFLDKDGYVREADNYFNEDNTYTLSACKAACTRKYKNNCQNVNIEKRAREYREKNGKTNSTYDIYKMTSYEPFAVEV